MKQERSKVKSDILLRVRLLYVLFILAGAIVRQLEARGIELYDPLVPGEIIDD